jgi:large-conductance mechanosensitive channel
MSSPEITLPSDRSFGFTFVVVFALIAAWQAWVGRAAVAFTFGGLSIAILVVALARPALLHALNRAWMRFGALLHKVVNPIVLGGIYFLVFTPVALIMRLAGRDALRRKLDTQAKSYWIDRDPPGPPPDSLPNQF